MCSCPLDHLLNRAFACFQDDAYQPSSDEGRAADEGPDDDEITDDEWEVLEVNVPLLHVQFMPTSAISYLIWSIVLQYIYMT